MVGDSRKAIVIGSIILAHEFAGSILIKWSKTNFKIYKTNLN